MTISRLDEIRLLLEREPLFEEIVVVGDKQRRLKSVDISSKGSASHGLKKMLQRLNAVLGSPYEFEVNPWRGQGETITINLQTTNDKAQEKNELILLHSVRKREYLNIYQEEPYTYDVKLGLSCNNNCKHCVVKPNIRQIKRKVPEAVTLDSGYGMWCSKDLSFRQVVDLLKCTPETVSRYQITGGEPTIRRDFIKIIKWIYYNRPKARVALQTNGRNLSDMDIVKGFRRYTRDPSVAVAVHGLEDTHNSVVNNRKETGNPYAETIQGIRNLQKAFGEDPTTRLVLRTEMVLSQYNMADIFESVRYQHEELGIDYIGISFPHLCGFSQDEVRELAPTYEQVLELLDVLNSYLENTDHLMIKIEEVPFCVFDQINKEQGHILVESFECSVSDKKSISMNFMGDEKLDFGPLWLKDHSKPGQCKDCILNDMCVGVWKETLNLNSSYIVPITKADKRLDDFLKRHWGETYKQRCC